MTILYVILDQLHDKSVIYGLSIDIKKSKTKLVGVPSVNNPTTDVTSKSQPIGVVEYFEYLGRTLSCRTDDTRAVESRIS